MKAVIFTTINTAENLYRIQQHCPGWTPIIAGDLKTPHEANRRICAELGGVYLDPEMQMTLGFTHAAALPWNCYGRKNIAYLFALKEGAEAIYITDDDNVPVADWAEHVRLGPQETDLLTSSNGWYNAYEGAETGEAGPITPRGFPWEHIGESAFSQVRRDIVNVGVIAGLPLGDPDVDAATRIIRRPWVRGYPARDVALDQGTLCPYDSQNTVIVRELVPANMLWSYAASGPVGQNWVRFDDICAGYVGQVIAWKYGYRVRFGRPFVMQERNPHDLANDLWLEIGGMRRVNQFTETLRRIPLTGRTPAEDLQIIVQGMLQALPELPRCLQTYVDTWVYDLEQIGLRHPLPVAAVA